MKKCTICGKPMEWEWAEVCPFCVVHRIEEVVASVFFGNGSRKDFTDGSPSPFEDAIQFFNQCSSRAKLVVKDPLQSWRLVKEK